MKTLLSPTVHFNVESGLFDMLRNRFKEKNIYFHKDQKVHNIGTRDL